MKELIARIEAGEQGWLFTCELSAALGGLAVGDMFDLDNALDDSLDGAVKFTQRTLPGWHWSLCMPGYDEGVYQDGKAGVIVHHPLSSGGGPLWKGFANSPARALILAVLRAKLAEAKRG